MTFSEMGLQKRFSIAFDTRCTYLDDQNFGSVKALR